MMLPGARIPLGERHALMRPIEDRRTADEGGTETFPVVQTETPRLGLIVGRGTDARRVSLDQRPVSVGSGRDNEVVLFDRAVSARHVRLEPTDRGVFVRDLGSRNGTYIDGLRVMRARAHEGVRIRVGRTDLAIVALEKDIGAPMVAASSQMMAVLSEANRFSKLSWPVLIHGESGSGKEGIARLLHAAGPRSTRPFVAVNAGGLPRDLIESELFGHEKGAFTGASGMRRGVFEQADGGTLFLDEIGELPLDMQARLLRTLETWEVRRVGSEAGVRVDVRVVCATHRDVRAMVGAGMFREDLYYRLTRLVLHVPPLRERPDDVGALAIHFLREMSRELGARSLSETACARLDAYPWPGNARELRNVLGAAAAGSASTVLEAADIDRAIAAVAGPYRTAVEGGRIDLFAVLRSHHGNLSSAARALGLPRSTLRDRLKRT